MKTDSFIHQRVSFVDAFSYVNGWPPVSDENICETCTNLLESAYVFRQMCRAANHPIYNVCHCCLQEKSDSNYQFLDMRNAVFEHNNKSVTFFEGYFDVNSLEDPANFTNFDVSICEDCAMQLKSAYVFRRMCQKTADSGQEYSRLHSAHWRSHNTNTNTRRKADNKRIAIRINAGQRNLKTQRPHDIQQISFSFNCKKCPKTFKSKIKLSSHRKIKHKDVRRTRDLYARVSKRKSTLPLCGRFNTHNRSVHQMDCNVHMLQQKYSVKEVNSSSSLNTLKKSFHGKLQYRCKRCPKAFQTQYSLITHVQREHLNKSYDCKDCDKVFTSRSGLNFHKASIHLKIQHQCEQCLKNFSGKRTLRAHVENIHEEKQYSCQCCNKLFKTLRCLTVHQKLQYRCKKCPKAFQTQCSLVTHIHKDHLNKSYDCKDCDKVFNTPAGLRQHNLGHSKSHQCEKCSKAYRSRAILLQHIETKHENLRLACQYCDKVFKSYGGLYNHKTTIHAKKLFKCKFCDKIYKNPTCLSAHTNAKHLNKTFQCVKCSKIYLRKDDFINHYRSKHLNIVFACQDCDNVFTSKNGLKSHKARKHLKIMHQCEQCPKTFLEKRRLRLHVEKIHEKKYYSRL
jgi:hypothetical protein